MTPPGRCAITATLLLIANFKIIRRGRRPRRPVQPCVIAKLTVYRRGGFHIRPCNPAQSPGASRTPPPTNCQKAATKNRNCEPSNRRVLAPGRGQSVHSWVLRGALAKRSRKERTQAPLSRAAVRSRSDQSPSGALKHTSGPALRDGGARCAPPSARYRKWRDLFRFLLGFQKEHLSAAAHYKRKPPQGGGFRCARTVPQAPKHLAPTPKKGYNNIIAHLYPSGPKTQTKGVSRGENSPRALPLPPAGRRGCRLCG